MLQRLFAHTSPAWHGPLALALGCGLLAALLRHWALWQTPFANGWDSYFYLVQLKSLRETGQMHSPDAALIYPYLRFWAWLLGDYVAGMKLGLALLCGVFCGLLCLPFRQGETLSLARCAWGLFSPQLAYVAAQYPKNLLGMVLLLAFVRSLERCHSGAWRWPALLLLLNYFGHRLCFGLALAYLCIWVFFEQKKAILANFRRLRWWHGLAGALLLAALSQLPGLPHWADLGRLEGLFSTHPQFAWWSFWSNFDAQRIGPWWRAESIAVTALFLLLPLLAPWRIGPLWLLCALMLFPFLEWSYTGLAWRLWLSFGLLAPLALLAHPLPRRWDWALAAALLGSALFSWRGYDPAKHDPDYARYEQLVAASGLRPGGTVDLLIAHNALAEYATFRSGVDAMPWLPEYSIDSTRLWRLAAGLHPPELRHLAGSDNTLKIKYLGNGYCLLPEWLWQRAIRQAQLEGNQHFLENARAWHNPSRMRPGWLLRRR